MLNCAALFVSWTLFSAQPRERGIIYGGAQIEVGIATWIFYLFTNNVNFNTLIYQESEEGKGLLSRYAETRDFQLLVTIFCALYRKL